MTSNSRAAIYTRVSSLKKEKGYSLEVQEEVCRDYCDYKNFEVKGVYSDPGVSGAIQPIKRKNMNRLIEDVKNGMYDVIVFYALDRLSRDNFYTLEFVRIMNNTYNVQVAFCRDNIDSNTYQGKFKLGIISSIAELELSVIKDRLGMGKEETKKRGGDIGNRLFYGYARSTGKTIIIDEADANIVRYIFTCYYKHKISMNKIAKALNRDNIKTPKDGLKWYPATIRCILKNENVYRGGLVGNNINNVRWPVILHEDYFMF